MPVKQKKTARQRREEQELLKKKAMGQPSPGSVKAMPIKVPEPVTVPKPKDVLPHNCKEEETREFLEYLSRDELPVFKDEPLSGQRKKSAAAKGINWLYLKEGMPTVEKAIHRMNAGLKEMWASKVTVVKLIHGYGSTGKGGKIRVEIRKELGVMKRRRLIRDFIPGEDFGPLNPASRILAEKNRTITHDQDWGGMNPDVTIVIL